MPPYTPVNCVTNQYQFEDDETNLDHDSVQHVRECVLDHVGANPELYDPLDVKQIRDDDWQVQRYILRCKGNLDRSIEMIKESLQFRHSINLAQLGPHRFPPEFFRAGAMFQSLPNKQNHGVMFVRIKFHRKIKELTEGVFQFSAYCMNKLDQQTNGHGLMLVADFQDAGFANMDLGLTYRMAQSIVRYYPYGKVQVLVLDFPALFVSAWNMMKSWLPAEYTEIITFIPKEQIFDYIDRANVPFYLGGDSPLNYYSVPNGTINDDQILGLGIVNQKRIDEIRELYRPRMEEAEQQSWLIKQKHGDKMIKFYEFRITDLEQGRAKIPNGTTNNNNNKIETTKVYN